MPSTTKLTKTRHDPTAEQETNTEHKAKSRCRIKVIQGMPRLMNKKPTQNAKRNHMSIEKGGGRRPTSKVQDMPPTSNSSKITRHALLKKKVADGHLLKYKTCTQRQNFQRIQDLPQLINKKPTQNTKQNHMLTKREGVPKATLQSRRHASNC